jgi:hypothetical protein
MTSVKDVLCRLGFKQKDIVRERRFWVEFLRGASPVKTGLFNVNQFLLNRCELSLPIRSFERLRGGAGWRFERVSQKFGPSHAHMLCETLLRVFQGVSVVLLSPERGDT